MKHLTPQQERFLPAIEWLLGYGPLGSGRTELMALAFLKRGMEQPGSVVRVFDHNVNVNPQVMLNRIAFLADKHDPPVRLETGRDWFRVYPPVPPTPEKVKEHR